MAVTAIKKAMPYQEIKIGAGTREFLLQYFPIKDSLAVYLNGVLLERGQNKDYVYDENTNIITLSLAIEQGDILQILYMR